jgi:hypothetical protein
MFHLATLAQGVLFRAMENGAYWSRRDVEGSFLAKLEAVFWHVTRGWIWIWDTSVRADCLGKNPWKWDLDSKQERHPLGILKLNGLYFFEGTGLANVTSGWFFDLDWSVGPWKEIKLWAHERRSIPSTAGGSYWGCRSDSSFSGTGGLPHATESSVDNVQTEMVVCQNNELLRSVWVYFYSGVAESSVLPRCDITSRGNRIQTLRQKAAPSIRSSGHVTLYSTEKEFCQILHNEHDRSKIPVQELCPTAYKCLASEGE